MPKCTTLSKPMTLSRPVDGGVKKHKYQITTTVTMLIGYVLRIFITNYKCANCSLLNCIHERAFLTVEDDDAEEEYSNRKDEAVKQAPPIHLAYACKHISEVGEDSLKRIAFEKSSQRAVARNGDWIDDWCRIHPQLKSEGDKIVQVTIPNCKCGDDESTAKSHQGYEHKQHRSPQKLPC